MVRSFRNRALRRLFEDNDRSRLPAEHVDWLRTILTALDTAERIEDLDLATFRLHRLQGRLKDFWAVTVRANWRVVLRFDDGDAFDIDYLDYH